MRKSPQLAMFLPILLILAACQSLGIPQADTFNKRVIVANGIVESTTTTIETLYLAGKLSKDEAQRANAQATNAATGIDVARTAHDSDPATGNTKLTSVIAALGALNAYLEQKK